MNRTQTLTQPFTRSLKRRLAGRATAAIAASVVSLQALAHEGHDHSHWSSGILHALFYVSAFAAFAAVSFAVFNKFKSRKLSTQK